MRQSMLSEAPQPYLQGVQNHNHVENQFGEYMIESHRGLHTRLGQIWPESPFESFLGNHLLFFLIHPLNPLPPLVSFPF